MKENRNFARKNKTEHIFQFLRRLFWKEKKGEDCRTENVRKERTRNVYSHMSKQTREEWLME